MAEQPWLAIGISRANWYRHGKPATKPQLTTQAEAAKLMDTSVRSLPEARGLP